MTALIKSMTACARCTNQVTFGTATWEIRSLNHRYLDLHVKLPDFLSFLEINVREIIREKLHRGRIDCHLTYQQGTEKGSQIALDNNLLEQLISNAVSIGKKIGNVAPIDPMAILSWPKILKQEEINIELVSEAILSLLTQTLDGVLESREREGKALKLVIERILATIDKEIIKIRERLPEVLASTKQKILNKFSDIKIELEPSRLEQEMIFFAQKIDITEELDRLEIHINEFQRILKNGGNVGKRLDFLLQELNREVNTLSSKSQDAKITQTAVEMKVLFEQIREQVQNLE